MASGQKSQNRKGILFLVFATLLLGLIGLIAWRVSLPWRLLRAATPSEASWAFQGSTLRAQPLRWTDGSLTLLAKAGSIESQWLELITNGVVNLIRLTEARVEFSEAPERFQQIDFSRWKNLLDPANLPIARADLSDASLNLSIFPSALDTDLTAIRNRAGAIDSTARVTGGGLSVQGFLRLGWDSLENGGSFEGSYDRRSNPYFFSFFDEEPFRSLLRPFGQIEFEGSFVLDKEWHFDQGIRLITASEPGAEFAGQTLTELAFSGATVFPNVLTRENRALLEGLLPDKITLFRIEARRRGDGPIVIEVTLNGKRLFNLDADSWREGAQARIHVLNTAQTSTGTLSLGPAGGMIFLPGPYQSGDLPTFRLPGILEISQPKL
ncbi:MAG: hypothetical protein ACQKBT_13030 [Puniceicoccales bacterium]